MDNWTMWYLSIYDNQDVVYNSNCLSVTRRVGTDSRGLKKAFLYII